METFIHEVVGEGARCCLIPCVIIMVTPVIMLWSLIVGRMGPDASDDKVCDTFWRVMRRLLETV